MAKNGVFAEGSVVKLTEHSKDIYSSHYFGTPNLIYTVLLGNDTIRCYDCIDQQYYNRKLLNPFHLSH